STPSSSPSPWPGPCFSRSSGGYASSTPVARAISWRRSRAGPIVCGFPCETTATFRAALADGGIDPPVELVGEAGRVSVLEPEDELTISFRARETGVCHAARLPSPGQRSLGHLAHDAPVHLRVAHDTARRLRPPRLELRLHE